MSRPIQQIISDVIAAREHLEDISTRGGYTRPIDAANASVALLDALNAYFDATIEDSRPTLNSLPTAGDAA